MTNVTEFYKYGDGKTYGFPWSERYRIMHVEQTKDQIELTIQRKGSRVLGDYLHHAKSLFPEYSRFLIIIDDRPCRICGTPTDYVSGMAHHPEFPQGVCCSKCGAFEDPEIDKEWRKCEKELEKR